MRALIIIFLLVLGTSSYAQSVNTKEKPYDIEKIRVAIGRSTTSADAMNLAMKADWLSGYKKHYKEYVAFTCDTSNMGLFVIILWRSTNKLNLSIFAEDGSEIQATLVNIEKSENVAAGDMQYKVTFESRSNYYAVILHMLEY
jgi:hypothetical protein